VRRKSDVDKEYRYKERCESEEKTHRNPFLNFLDTCLRYLILPVPVVFLLFAFCPHSYERILAEGYPQEAHAAGPK